MLNVPNGKITVSQLMLPIAIAILALFISISFQFTQILRDRSAMQKAFADQAKPLDDTMHLQAQVNALVLGTQKLAEKGDKSARTIVDKMVKLGIIHPNPAPSAAPAAAPSGGPNSMMRRPGPPPQPGETPPE